MEIQKIKRIKRLFKRLFSEPSYVLHQIKPKISYKIFSLFANFSTKSFFLNGVSLFLTWKCNLRCKMCNVWGEEGSASKGFLNKEQEVLFEDLKRVIDKLSYYSPNFVITGGEPFLYKNWYELTKYLREKKIKTMVLTNGTLLEENAEKIVGNIESMNISIDGPPEIHNKIRGQASFEKIISGIKKIELIKQNNRKKIPYINIACTISDLNYKEIENLIEILQKEKVKINTLLFQHLEFIDESSILKTRNIFEKEFNQKINIWEGFSYKMKDFDLKFLKETITKIKNTSYKDIYISFFPDFSDEELEKYYSQPNFIPSKNPKRCLGPWLEVLITPSLDLWICPDYKVGNLKEENFRKLWNNEKARIFRKKLIKEGVFLPVCRCCGCFYTR